jgi:hypothetical protein
MGPVGRWPAGSSIPAAGCDCNSSIPARLALLLHMRPRPYNACEVAVQPHTAALGWCRATAARYSAVAAHRHTVRSESAP